MICLLQGTETQFMVSYLSTSLKDNMPPAPETPGALTPETWWLIGR